MVEKKNVETVEDESDNVKRNALAIILETMTSARDCIVLKACAESLEKMCDYSEDSAGRLRQLVLNNKL